MLLFLPIAVEHPTCWPSRIIVAARHAAHILPSVRDKGLRNASPVLSSGQRVFCSCDACVAESARHQTCWAACHFVAKWQHTCLGVSRQVSTLGFTPLPNFVIIR